MCISVPMLPFHLDFRALPSILQPRSRSLQLGSCWHYLKFVLLEQPGPDSGSVSAYSRIDEVTTLIIKVVHDLEGSLLVTYYKSLSVVSCELYRKGQFYIRP